MKKEKFTIVFLVTAFILMGCSNNAEKGENVNEPTELTISAAVSLTDAMYDIQNSYEKENNVKLTFNMAGSGTLAQQIQQGAPADVFISANQDWMDTLEDKDALIDNSSQNITGNRIVLITQKDADIDYDSINAMQADELDQIAIGNPESVPAGEYSKQILQHLNLWDELEDNIILAKDVRQVLTYVESGNADIGFVYASDALTSDKINILATAEKDWHDPIIYPGAVVNDTEHEKAATDFLHYMLSDKAQDILKEYGFES